MKENRPYFCFIILVLAVLLLPTLVHSQGDDFGFQGGIEPWSQNQLPTPVPGTDYTAGYVQNSWQQLQNRRGDTIVMDFVMDWYGLGPLSISPMASSQTGMHWTGPNTPAGVWGHSPFGYWCLRCEFQFQAGDDNVAVWLDFIGSERFGAHLEVKQVIPNPASWFSVLSDPDKGTAGGIATFFNGFSGVLAGAAAGFYSDPPLAAVLGGVAYAGNLFANHFNDIARDPWDVDFCSETPFYLNQQTINDFAWMRDYDSSGWLTDSIELVDAYGIQATTAANRALSAVTAGAYDCAWVRRWEALQAMNRMGDYLWYFRWAVQYDAWGQVDGLDGQLDGVAWSAGWLEELQ